MKPTHQFQVSSSAPPRARPKVLVLLAAYNGAAWIKEQIESILTQEHVDVRLIIRDDASSDSTIEAVRQIADVNHRVDVIRADIPSRSAAENFFSMIRSCDATRFNFVALSDQDDIWHSDKLHQAVESLQRSASSGYSSAVTAIWPTGTSRILRQEVRVTESDYLFEGAGQGCTFVLAEAFYGRLRNFLVTHDALTSGVHFHDWTIYALARTWGLQWTFNTRSTMEYRQHGNNDTGARGNLSAMRMRLARIRQGWYSKQLVQIAAICHAGSPEDLMLERWQALLHEKRTWRRRIRIAHFCFRGGRRRRRDNLVLLLSGLMGWL